MRAQARLLVKAEILSNLKETRERILSVMERLSVAQRDQVFLGAWSPKDLLAHLIGWDETNLQAVQSVLKGTVPAFYQHHDRNWQTYNAMLVARHKQGSFEDMLATARSSQQALLGFLQTIPPEDFKKDFGVRVRGYNVTLERLLEAEAKDERVHYRQIVDFFRPSE